MLKFIRTLAFVTLLVQAPTTNIIIIIKLQTSKQ